MQGIMYYIILFQKEYNFKAKNQTLVRNLVSLEEGLESMGRRLAKELQQRRECRGMLLWVLVKLQKL